jgi:hypothetical protein
MTLPNTPNTPNTPSVPSVPNLPGLTVLTTHLWLQLPTEVRQQLSRDLGLTRSGTASIITSGSATRVESDGHTASDLAALTPERLAEYAGVTGETDTVRLLELAARKAQSRVSATGAERDAEEIEKLKADNARMEAIAAERQEAEDRRSAPIGPPPAPEQPTVTAPSLSPSLAVSPQPEGTQDPNSTVPPEGAALPGAGASEQSPDEPLVGEPEPTEPKKKSHKKKVSK